MEDSATFDKIKTEYNAPKSNHKHSKTEGNPTEVIYQDMRHSSSYKFPLQFRGCNLYHDVG